MPWDATGKGVRRVGRLNVMSDYTYLLLPTSNLDPANRMKVHERNKETFAQ